MSHRPRKCEDCLSYDHIKVGCKEKASPNYGGCISPLSAACPCFISALAAFSTKNRPKKWRKAQTLADMCDPTARLY